MAVGLTLPLLALLLAVFVIPIGLTLIYATWSSEVREGLPGVYEQIRDWDGEALPGEQLYATLAGELAAGYEAKTIAQVGTRLNYEISGFRSLIMRTGRKAHELEAPFKESLINLNKKWGEIEYWRALKMGSRTVTPKFLLQSVELQETWEDGLQPLPEDQSVYITYLSRTFSIAFWVTVICVVLGYPLAYFITHSTPLVSSLMLGAVLLPFWTSVLVRMAAWMTLLQKEGIINGMLLRTGIVEQPLQMVFNRFGLYVAMVHVLLPFMVLPIYSVMQKVPPLRVRAAMSLGATPIKAFWQIYVPDTLPGLSAGCLLVFIVALGYYITPVLIGGPADQMLSTLITVFALQTANWAMASSVSILLLVATLIIYFAFSRMLGAKVFDI